MWEITIFMFLILFDDLTHFLLLILLNIICLSQLITYNISVLNLHLSVYNGKKIIFTLSVTSYNQFTDQELNRITERRTF